MFRTYFEFPSDLVLPFVSSGCVSDWHISAQTDKEIINLIYIRLGYSRLS